jgi:hypothetical protein
VAPRGAVITIVLTRSVLGVAGIAAEGVGQGGMQGEDAVQAGEAKNAQDQPLGADQSEGTGMLVVAAQAPQGADQHAKAQL